MFKLPSSPVSASSLDSSVPKTRAELFVFSRPLGLMKLLVDKKITSIREGVNKHMSCLQKVDAHFIDA